jgi:hypothetical protein
MASPGIAGESAGRSAGIGSDSTGAGGQGTERIWDKMGPASFEIEGYPKVVFPVWNQLEGSHGVRVVARAVPWVDGEQLDETGLTAKEWATESLFLNDLSNEIGIGTDPPLYPDRLELLETVLEQKKTGTLHLPWRRNIRCKAVTWRRRASVEMQDCETFSVQWKCDNENKLKDPSKGSGVRANIAYRVEQARFEAERAGIGGFSWEDITTFASQLEAIVAAPGLFLEDIGQKANRVSRACDSILGSFQKAGIGRNMLLDPGGSIAFGAIRDLRDLADGAEEEARGVPNRVVSRRSPIDGSIWQIAMLPDWAQDPEQMLRINPQIPDPNWITKGTTLNILV